MQCRYLRRALDFEERKSQGRLQSLVLPIRGKRTSTDNQVVNRKEDAPTPAGTSVDGDYITDPHVGQEERGNA